VPFEITGRKNQTAGWAGGSRLIYCVSMPNIAGHVSSGRAVPTVESADASNRSTTCGPAGRKKPERLPSRLKNLRPLIGMKKYFTVAPLQRHSSRASHLANPTSPTTPDVTITGGFPPSHGGAARGTSSNFPRPIRQQRRFRGQRITGPGGFARR